MGIRSLVLGLGGVTVAFALSIVLSTAWAQSTQPAESTATKPEPREPMDNAAIARHLRRFADEVAGGGGRWRAQVDGTAVMVVTDQRADRMRIVSRITEADELSEDRLRTLLEANFDRALDARYAIANEQLWACYIHPLSPLTPAELESGARQVIAIKENYGDSFASTGLVFGGEQPAGQSGSDRNEPYSDGDQPANDGDPSSGDKPDHPPRAPY